MQKSKIIEGTFPSKYFLFVTIHVASHCKGVGNIPEAIL
jgi:hypothetical protein